MKRLQSLFQPMVVSVLLMMGVGQIACADCPVSLIIDPSQTSLSILDVINGVGFQFSKDQNTDDLHAIQYIYSHYHGSQLTPANSLFYRYQMNAANIQNQPNTGQLYWLEAFMDPTTDTQNWVTLPPLVCGGLYELTLVNASGGTCSGISMPYATNPQTGEQEYEYIGFQNCQVTVQYVPTLQKAQDLGISVNVQNTTPHVILVSTPSSGGGHMSQVISPNQNQVFSLSSNYSQTTELFSVSGARIYASPFGDLADFDKSINLTLTETVDTTNQKTTEPNALGLVQMQGQGYAEPVCDLSGDMTYDSLENCLHQVVQPQWYLWEVAPQNVIAECDNTVTQHIGAFCWHNTTTGEEFDVNIQDPPGTITATA